jgi:hypothetical protein
MKSGSQVVMDISKVSPGWYLIEIRSGDKISFQKFVKGDSALTSFIPQLIPN